MVVFEEETCKQEVVQPRCEDPQARYVEGQLLQTIRAKEMIGDDKVVPDFFLVLVQIESQFFGVEHHRTVAEEGLGYHDEPVHPIWDDCLSKLPNLRKVSISTWCDEAFMAKRRSKAPVIYSRKPSPNFLGVAPTLDEDTFRAYIKHILDQTRDCHVEIIFRDIYTLHGDPAKARRVVEIVRSLV